MRCPKHTGGKSRSLGHQHGTGVSRRKAGSTERVGRTGAPASGVRRALAAPTADEQLTQAGRHLSAGAENITRQSSVSELNLSHLKDRSEKAGAVCDAPAGPHRYRLGA